MQIFAPTFSVRWQQAREPHKIISRRLYCPQNFGIPTLWSCCYLLMHGMFVSVTMSTKSALQTNPDVLEWFCCTLLVDHCFCCTYCVQASNNLYYILYMQLYCKLTKIHTILNFKDAIYTRTMFLYKSHP